MAFQTLEGRLDLATGGIDDGVSSVDSAMGDLEGRLSSAGQRMQSAGTTMTAGLTAPLVAMGGAAARQSANFDQAMQKSVAVMSDVSETMREDLEATAREVATSTTQSHEQAAQSFYFLASAGLDAAESMEAMPQVAAFAEAGQMDMAEATDVATNVMSAFGYEAEQMSEVTDTLTATVTSHNQTMNGMADAMSRVAPTAAGMGVEIEEAAAAIGLLGDVGIQGQRAGTALNRALTVLSNPTGRAAERIEELGVSVRDSSGDLRSITGIMADFEAAGASSADMAAIFGTEAGPAMSSLLQQGSDALAESTTSLKEAEGATQDVADTQRDTLNAQLQILRSRLNDVAVTVGSRLLPVINSAAARLQPIAERFSNLSDRQQTMIITAAALAAAIGPLLLGLGTLLTLIPTLSAAAGSLGAVLGVLAGPVGLVAAAVAALAAAWMTDFMGIRTATMNAVNKIMKTIGPLLSMLRNEAGETIDHWRSVFSDGLAFVEELWAKHGDSVMSVLGPVLRNIRIVVEGMIDTLITVIRAGLAILRGDFTDAFEIIENFLDRQTDRYKQIGRNLIEALINGIKAAAPNVSETVKGIVNDVRDFLPGSDAETGPLSDLTAAGEALPKTFAGGMSNNNRLVDEASARVANQAQPHLRADGSSTGRMNGLSAEEIAKALRGVLGDLVLVEGEMEVHDEEWDRLITPHVQVVLREESDRFDRGVGE